MSLGGDLWKTEFVNRNAILHSKYTTFLFCKSFPLLTFLFVVRTDSTDCYRYFWAYSLYFSVFLFFQFFIFRFPQSRLSRLMSALLSAHNNNCPYCIIWVSESMTKSIGIKKHSVHFQQRVGRWIEKEQNQIQISHLSFSLVPWQCQ